MLVNRGGSPAGLIQPWGAHSSSRSQSVVSIGKSIGTTTRNFLYTDPDYVDSKTGHKRVNEFSFYRMVAEADPNVGGAIDFISQSMSAAYRGIGFRDDYNEDGSVQKVYKPADGFKDQVESLLVEIKFASMLKPTLDGLNLDGNTFYRLWRENSEIENAASPGRITEVELIPASTLTIVSREVDAGEYDGSLITDRDLYYVNEAPITSGDSDTVTGDKVTSATEREFTKIAASDMLHFGRNRIGNLFTDPIGRRTMNVWGVSPLRSLAMYVKLKLFLWLDYARWFHSSVPRLDAAIDAADLLNPDNYTGSSEEKATAMANAVTDFMTRFQESLLTEDTDETSPTYGEKIPMEPDHAFVHLKDIVLSQLGGASIGPDVFAAIEACDRVLCTRLGVPMTFFGYERGSTYAVSYVTKQFMNVYGTSLVRGLELELRSFIARELHLRGIDFNQEDVDRLILVLEVQDEDQQKAEREDQKADIEIAERIATMVIALYTNTVLSHKEVRKILRDQAPKFFKSLRVLDVDGYYAPPQPAQVSLAEAVGEHTTSLLTRTNESEEAAIERTYQEGTKTLLETVASEVEAGNTDLTGGE